MSGAVSGTTTNYNLSLINYDFPTWYGYAWDNLRIIDGVMGSLLIITQFGGLWTNAATYVVDDVVVDADDGLMYVCLVGHTAASTGTFSADRTSNPTYWDSFSTVNGVAINSDVAAVAAITADVTTVAGISSDVTTVAGVSADVTTLAGISSDITTVVGNEANISTVAGIDSDVTTVASINTNVTAVAGNESDITIVAGIDSDVTTVAGVSTDVTTVATNITDVSTVATNITDVTNFSDVYYGPNATDPTTRKDSSALQEGDLYFNTADDEMRVYDGTAWEDVAIPLSEVQAGAYQWCGTASGTANAITLSATPALTAYTSGQPLLFKVATTNTGATTINVDGVGVVNLYNDGAALKGNELIAGAVVSIAYDGTQFQLTTAAPSGGLFRGNNGTVGNSLGDIFRINARTLTVDETIESTDNASCAGPLTVDTGVTLTVASGGELVIL